MRDKLSSKWCWKNVTAIGQKKKKKMETGRVPTVAW